MAVLRPLWQGRRLLWPRSCDDSSDAETTNEALFEELDEEAMDDPMLVVRDKRRRDDDDDDDDDDDEDGRPRKRVRYETLPRHPWMPAEDEVPLLAWYDRPWESTEAHLITLTYEGRSTSFWSHANTRNEHPRTRDVVFVGGFDAPHEHYYVVDGIRGGYTSVTTFLKRFFPPFKRELIARRCIGSRRPGSPYAGMKTVQEVYDHWDKVRDNGTCYHAIIEDTLLGHASRTVYQINKSDEITAPPPGFLRFMTDYPGLQPFLTEVTIVDRDCLLVGQADALFWDRDRGRFILVDWKNVREFRTQSSERGVHPLTAGLMACHLIEYTLQLNLYRTVLERHYGIVIAEMWIVNFPPTEEAVANGVYQRYVAERYDMMPFLALCPVTEEGRARRVWAPSEPYPPYGNPALYCRQTLAQLQARPFAPLPGADFGVRTVVPGPRTLRVY